MMAAAMGVRHLVRAALAALVVLSIAACSAADDPLSPHRSPAPLPDSTQAPHGAVALEGRLPDTIGGTTLAHSSYDGPSFLASGTSANRAALTTMLAQLGRSVDDLSLAQATDPSGKLQFVEGIFRVAGAPPDQLESAWLAAQQSSSGDQLVQGTVNVGGMTVTKLSDPNGDTTWVVPRNDSLVLILTNDDALVSEAISKIR
jgi:hypothetical protein